MKRNTFLILLAVSLLLTSVFSGCTMRTETPASTPAPTAAPTPEPTAVPTPEPTAVPTATPAPAHSDLYIEGLSVEDVILYFNEVVLDSEFVTSGDPSYVQKWADPISFMLHGTYTQTDYEVLTELVTQLNGIEGFPGMYECWEESQARLNIYFCTQQELNDRMSNMTQDTSLDGAVTFWYDEGDRIYSEIICIRTDLDQTLRNSVILEEIYNGLGPVQDTTLREDSIIYQYSSTALSLTDTDILLLKLLYHPSMLCGMNPGEAHSVIRELYY